MESKHFLFTVSTTDPSITGRGSAGEWLEHYKLAADDDVFIPWAYTGGEVIEPVEGDWLWMAIDKLVVARVPIKRVFEDPLNHFMELWFDGKEIKHIAGLTNYYPETMLHLPQKVVAEWLAKSEG